MLKRLQVKNFTVFAEANFEFGPGLNVVVGTNGTGKSHVLKLGYAVEVVREQVKHGAAVAGTPALANEETWGFHLSRCLPALFQVSGLGPLVSFGPADRTATVEVVFSDEEIEESVQFELDGSSQSLRIVGGREAQGATVPAVEPVFIPAKEILTLSYLTDIDKQYQAPVELNFLRLLAQLRKLPLRNSAAPDALNALTHELGGNVVRENERFYLVRNDGQRLEMNMVAEGLRKFGTLQKLLANGSLTADTTLFWDEPEANLNPALLKKLAAVLAGMARQGFQIILATHSLFLLKQLHILSRQPAAQPLPVRYFGLNAQPGGPTHVSTTDDFEELPDVVALDEELAQAGEFLDVLNGTV